MHDDLCAINNDENDELEEEKDLLLILFIQTYPEFAGLDDDTIKNTMTKIKCIYTQFSNIDSEDCEVFAFLMLVAHYLVINGYGRDVGVEQGGGVISSSSIDGISVSYSTAPIKDNFQYFFNQTPYGMEYLAWLNTRSGILLVN